MGIATTVRMACHQFHANGIIVSTIVPESSSGWVSVGPEPRDTYMLYTTGGTFLAAFISSPLAKIFLLISIFKAKY